MTVGRRNPYHNRAALTEPSDFFGRANELSGIYERIGDGTSVSLIGERRVGKSSLLYALDFPGIRAEFRVSSSLRFVFIDMQTIGGVPEAEMLEYLIFKIAGALGVEPGEPRRPTLRLLAQQARARDVRLVVIIDEFDVLVHAPGLSEGFLGFLRSWTSEFRMPFVVASREGSIDPVAIPEVGSSFLNIFSPLYVGPMSPSDAEQLIRVPSEEADAPFSDEDVAWISELAGRHPLFLQIAAYHLFDLRPSVARADLRAALRRQFDFEAMPQFNYLMSRLSAAEVRALMGFAGRRETIDPKFLDRFLRMGMLIEGESGLRVFSSSFQEQLEEPRTHESPRGILPGVRSFLFE